ncbi:MAG TPA: hypothetical protein VG895_03285 [Patescibacteria group bacterium]|nr:hypothetical protein [Patescibacteria group bacterium]
MRKNRLTHYLTANIYLILLLIAGTVSWSITMIKSGIIYSFGMGFWGANGHDGIWHIALINSLARGSFEMPVFAGQQIKNYHLGFDLLLAAIHTITQIPTVNLYFQIVPPILAILIGITCYLFMMQWTKSKVASFWAIFFIYFGGDISWIFGKGESTFWAQQGISTLINPPFALSLIFIFLGLYFLLKKNKYLPILFFGILLETKAYAGVLILGSLFLVGTWEYLREKKIDIFKIFFGSSVLTLILFLLLNRGSENLFIFQPFWFLQNLFNLDRFLIPKLASAITNYNLAHNWIKLGPALIIAFIVFWIGNMWTRLLKEFEVIRWLRHPKTISSLDVFVTSIVISGAAIPMFFVQKGTPWNTIQFFYYSLFFSAILGGVGINLILKSKSKNFKIIFSITIILLTIPTTVITLMQVYIPGRPPAKIDNDEISALNFLSKQSDGIVLTYPYDQQAANAAINNPPRPLYLYDSTAYVSAFSNHTTFLEDEVNLDITNFNWRNRLTEENQFYNTTDQKIAVNFLKTNNIKYIYWVKPQRAKLGDKQLGLTKIFENNIVNIYRVN